MSGVFPAQPAPASRCWAEVSLDALRDNLAWIRQRVGPGVKIMTVVKADAYGHGLKSIAAHLMRCGTDVFGVASLDEARAVRSVGRGWPVLMLGACVPDLVGRAIRDQVRLTLSSETEAGHISREAQRLGTRAKVHLKVDTGMGRLGIEAREGLDLAQKVSLLPGLELEGIYTHFSSAEDDARFTAGQRRRFQQVLTALKFTDLTIACRHASNSAGLLHEPSAWYDLVRPGLLVFGVVARGRRRVPGDLRNRFSPALSLRARVTLVRMAKRGSPISYGHTFRTPQAMRLATVSVGYGDGYPRAGSGRAQVLVRGRRCPVVGTITMDQIVVDVSSVAEVGVGDEVTLLGRQGDEEITATELAAWCGTIPWEILTGISYRVPRLYRGAQAS